MLRRLLFLIVLLVFASRPAHAQTDKYPQITFAVDSHSFGTLENGAVISYVFKFHNTGNADLIIKDATTLCGCTVAEYTKAPVKPGGSGTVKVTFNSTDKIGQQHKTVTLLTNCREPSKVLKVYAVVKPPHFKKKTT